MLFMRRPPKGEGPVARGDCTRSLAAPVIDGVVGWGHLGQAAGIWGESRDAFDSDDAYDGYRVASAILAGSFIVSQVHGALWSVECRRRNTLSEEAMRDHLRAVSNHLRAASGPGQGQSQPKAPPVRRP